MAVELEDSEGELVEVVDVGAPAGRVVDKENASSSAGIM